MHIESATWEVRMGIVAKSKSKAEVKQNPFLLLAQNILCGPPRRDLTPEQIYALHEFFHEVAACGFKLYQTVPPNLADPVVKDKLAIMIGTKKPKYPVQL
jgi:hypothetical protein